MTDAGERMSEHPVLFNDEREQAILDDRKTQHRLPMVPQPGAYAGGCHPANTARHDAPYIDAYCSEPKTAANPRGMSVEWCWWTEDDRPGPFLGRCPFGEPGDRLWGDRVVKRVWVERVREISSPDAKAEGFREIYYGSACSAIEPFVETWDAIYATKGFGWSDNPWVWACEFDRRENA